MRISDWGSDVCSSGLLTDPSLLDRLVTEKLQVEGEKIGTEGWKWVATAVDLPWGVTNGLREIDGVPVPRTPEEEARLAELEAEAEKIEAEWSDDPNVQIGRAHVCTPVTNAHLVCRLLLEKKTNTQTPTIRLH